MYSQLSRTERRNYYGNPHDPVYARRLREQCDVYFSRRMGSDYPPLDPSQRRESYEMRSGDDYPQVIDPLQSTNLSAGTDEGVSRASIATMKSQTVIQCVAIREVMKRPKDTKDTYLVPDVLDLQLELKVPVSSNLYPTYRFHKPS